MLWNNLPRLLLLHAEISNSDDDNNKILKTPVTCLILPLHFNSDGMKKEKKRTSRQNHTEERMGK